MWPLTPIPSKQQIESTAARNGLFVPLAFGVEIARDAVEAVSALGNEIDAREQMLRDEAAEAPGVRGLETDELVEQERRGAREVGLPCQVERRNSV